MHEASLVRSLLNQVTDLARQHGGGSVTEIRVEIGPLAGVEPLLVRSAFEQLVCGTELDDATLVIDEVPLVARCETCGEFAVDGFRFRCPGCDASRVTVVRGDEFRIASFTFAETAENPI